MSEVTARELVEGRLLKVPTPFTLDCTEDWVSRVPDVPGIYLFKGELGDSLYVGISSNIRRRAGQHMKGKGNLDLHRYMSNGNHVALTVFPEEDTGYQELLESYLILVLKPRYNVSKRHVNG